MLELGWCAGLHSYAPDGVSLITVLSGMLMNGACASVIGAGEHSMRAVGCGGVGRGETLGDKIAKALLPPAQMLYLKVVC